MSDQELTPLQSAEWIEDQIRKGGAVFCPFCHGMNNPGEEETPCCRPFALAIKDRADSLVKSFANQYTAVEIGASSSITCPWCREVNRAPAPRNPADWKRIGVSPFCCDFFQMALRAHLEVKRLNSLVHRADQIAEAYDKAAKN